MNKQVLLEETYIKSFKDELNKIASGDMLQYFSDHPEKLKEKIKRDKRKELLKKMNKRRDPDGIEKDGSIPVKAINEELRFLIGKLIKRETKRPIKEKFKEQVESDGHQKTAQPTPAQAEAGNYKKKHIRYNGMEISIENIAGSNRTGISRDGKEWKTKLHHHYGYIKKTVAKDAPDQVDVFINPGTTETEKVFIVNQINPKDKSFDEHKCLLGFNTESEAKSAYLSNYEKGWKGLGSIVEMPIEDFKKWVYSGRKMDPAKELVMEKKSSIYLTAFINELNLLTK